MRYIILCVLSFLILNVRGVSADPLNHCELYPITLPNALLASDPNRLVYEQIPLGTGPGNYSWLTWDGNNDAPSLAASLIPPGNSDTYINPNDLLDHQVSIGDWVQGRPGVKNSRDIRDNLTALLGRNIQIPIWSINDGQGSQFNYLTVSFAEIELTDFKLNGHGWISFVYKGPADCDGQTNTPPVAQNINLQTIEGNDLNLEVIATDADNDSLTYIIVTPPQHGSLSGSGPDYVYTPDTGFTGEDTFSFQANDGQDVSNVAIATITVVPDNSNSPPIADDLETEGLADTSIDILLIASDADDDVLTYLIVTPPQHGELVGDGPDYIYLPDPGFVGEDSFSFQASDGQALSNIAVGIINVLPNQQNSPPVAEDVNAEGLADTAVDVFVVATDPDNDPLSYFVVTPPLHGELTGDGPNYIYVPDPGYVGEDTFSFQASDGQDTSNVAVATINVLPNNQNSPPVAEDVTAEGLADTAVEVFVFASDADDDPLTYLIVTPPMHGELIGDGPNYIYVPDPGFVGEDNFSFQASDGQDLSNVAVATITMLPNNQNTPPIAEDVTADGVEDTALDITVFASDADDDVLSYIIVSQPEHGVLLGEGPNYTYVPDPGFVGDDSFSFQASDGQALSNIASVNITIAPNSGNSAPIAEDRFVETFEETNVTFTLFAFDPDDDELTFIIVTPPANGTLSNDGSSYTYTPNAGFIGTDFFEFKANDGSADSNTAQVEISVLSFED